MVYVQRCCGSGIVVSSVVNHFSFCVHFYKTNPLHSNNGTNLFNLVMECMPSVYSEMWVSYFFFVSVLLMLLAWFKGSKGEKKQKYISFCRGGKKKQTRLKLDLRRRIKFKKQTKSLKFAFALRLYTFYEIFPSSNNLECVFTLQSPSLSLSLSF